jgi:polyferredoxin
MIRRRRVPVSRILRYLSQAGFSAFILIASVRHALSVEHLPSTDAYCPFGGLATLWRWATAGRYVQKTHSSNLVLGLGLLVGVLLAGGAFCGWICPLGALQDLLEGIRKRLRIPAIKVPARLDRWLTYGRYLVLVGILYATISTTRLWFSDYDPYRTIFSLGWIFEPNLAEHWPAYLVAVVTVGVALLVPRAWCRYACPLGGAISLLQRLSLFRIRRDTSLCIDCGKCDRVCPTRLPVATSRSVTADCISCLECIETCPVPGALDVTLAVVPQPSPKEEAA